MSIASAIEAYLAGASRREDAAATLRMANRIGHRFLSQFSSVKEDRSGKISTTTVSHPCARRAAFKFQGTEEPPLAPKTIMNFFVGDIGEAALIALAKLAGIEIEGNNIELQFQGVTVHPDGRYTDAGGLVRNVEVKKVSKYGFEKAEKEGRVDDTFGYQTQASLECLAWLAAGVDVLETEFVLLAPETGRILSVYEPMHEDLVRAALERATVARGMVEPLLIPGLALEPERDWKKAGGYFETGRKVLPPQCKVCGWKNRCWPGAVLEEKHIKIPYTKQVWVMP